MRAVWIRNEAESFDDKIDQREIDKRVDEHCERLQSEKRFTELASLWLLPQIVARMNQ